MAKGYRVPEGVYVSFHSGPPNVLCYHIDGYSGECIVRVHKSLDLGNGNPPVEHVVDGGGFRIRVRERSAEDFLEELGKKLEEIAQKQ